jgi:hypothetical protein
MSDPATYRRYAEECRRIAKMVSNEHRSALLEIAQAWIELADEHEIDSRSDPQLRGMSGPDRLG